MKGVIADIVADIAVNRSGEAVGELIKRFCECDSGTMMAGLIAAAHVPLLLPAVALVGAKLLLSKSERAEQEEFQCHCDEVCHRLKNSPKTRKIPKKS